MAVTVPCLTLTSPAFADEEYLPDRCSLEGGNASPPLVWSGLPDETAELVLMCEDENVHARPFLHWLVTGIDPASSGVAEGAVPPGGQEWTNGFGEVGWGGPHPPPDAGPCRYIFRLYALAEPPSLPDRPRVDDIRNSMVGAGLAFAVLVGLYSAPESPTRSAAW